MNYCQLYKGGIAGSRTPVPYLRKGREFIFFQEVTSVLGLTDPWIALAYLSCLGSTALCISYAVWKSTKEE
ncbi:MAG: hypothetical protein K0R55_3847 [Sporomusa sp.]|nr:hypothetical protein [Sporomusa sp.]